MTTAKTKSEMFHFTVDGLERFAFSASSESDARSKVLGWVRRHGMVPSKVVVEIKSGVGTHADNIHNEWMA